MLNIAREGSPAFGSRCLCCDTLEEGDAADERTAFKKSTAFKSGAPQRDAPEENGSSHSRRRGQD